MKLRAFTLISALLCIGFFSCTKEEDDVYHPPTDPSDTTLHTDIGTQALLDVPAMPPISNLWGRMVAFKFDSSITDSAGTHSFVKGQYGLASFISSTGLSLNPSGVFLNDSELLDPNSFNIYKNTVDSNISLTNQWMVTGNQFVPAISYLYSGYFPDYIGTLPDTITKSNGLSVNFDAGTVLNADSVYLVVHSGSTSFKKAFGSAAGLVSISASEINALPLNAANKASILVIPFKYTIKVYGHKKFVFVKERETMKNVTIK